MKLKKVKPITKDKNGEITFHLDADETNADWIRSARLLKEGKRRKVEKMSKKSMYIENKTKQS